MHFALNPESCKPFLWPEKKSQKERGIQFSISVKIKEIESKTGRYLVKWSTIEWAGLGTMGKTDTGSASVSPAGGTERVNSGCLWGLADLRRAQRKQEPVM